MTKLIRISTLFAAFACSAALSTAGWATPDASVAAPLDAANTESVPEKNSKDEKIEVIRIEGNSTKIDEVRVRGETKSITVTPKHAPAYEISQKPASQSRSDKSTGRAQWRVLSF